MAAVGSKGRLSLDIVNGAGGLKSTPAPWDRPAAMLREHWHSRGRRPAPAPASGCPADGPPVALADKVARVAQAVTAMGERYRGIRSRFARVLAPG
jgi:hypothetical protein